jgi:hypothetical protein
MKVSTISSLGLGALLLGLVQTPAESVTIDLFTDVNDASGLQTASKRGVGSASEVDIGLNDVLGNSRFLQIEVLSGTRNAQLQVDTETGQAFLDTDTGVASRATLRWDANGAGLGGIDFTQNGHDSIVINIASIDQDSDLVFTVTDTFGNQGTLAQNLTGGFSGSTAYRYDNFSGSVDFTEINSIQLQTNNESSSLDFGFNFVQTAQEVPFEFSPSLGIVLSGSFFGFHVLKKKWKNNSSDKLIS